MSIVCDLYCRVSTYGQVQDGYSISEQEEMLKSYAKSQGWIVNAVYVDGGYSGKNMIRPGLQSVIKDAESKAINKVLVYKMDRLSRSQKEMLYLIEDIFIPNNVGFVSITETLDTGTPIGMAMIGILSAFAQLEREQIKERMMMGRTARVRSGKYHGGGNVPIGYKFDKYTDYLQIVPDEAEIVRSVFQKYADGDTANNIARTFNLQTPFRDRKWNAAHITRMLRNPVYIGKYRWKGELVECENHQSIIDEDLFNTVQSELERRCAERGTEKPQSPYKHKTLLGGIIWCEKCGRRYTGYKDRSKAGPIWRYYCYNRTTSGKMLGNKCDNKGWRCDTLNDLIVGEIRKLNADRSLESEPSNKPSRRETELSTIDARIAEIEKRYERLIDLFSIGSIDTATIQKRTDALASEKASLIKRREALENQEEGIKPEKVKALLDTFSNIVDNASPDYMELYPIVHELIRSITLNEDNIEIVWNFE